MRWVHVDPDLGLGVYPIIFNPVARKVESMNAVIIHDSQVHPALGRH
jgi:hypothetical protein